MFKSYRSVAEKSRYLGGEMLEDAHFIMVDVPIDRGKAKAVLPLGMRPLSSPTATLFIARYPKANFTGPYHESAMLIHVDTPLGRGVHCCWMVVDDDTALFYGRELLGYPKKIAHIVFEEEESGIAASVTRRGVELLKIEGKRGAEQSTRSPIFGFKTFNVGGMGQLFFFNPIWLFRPTEIVKQSFDAEVSVAVSPSRFDPIGELICGGPRRGRLAFGTVTGSRYNVPIGVAGLSWLSTVYEMRFH